MTESFKLCPKCNTERSPAEIYCKGDYHGLPCRWRLTDVKTITRNEKPPEGALPAPSQGAPENAPDAIGGTLPTSVARRCTNGHLIADGDMLCSACDAPVYWRGVSEPEPDEYVTQPRSLPRHANGFPPEQLTIPKTVGSQRHFPNQDDRNTPTTDNSEDYDSLSPTAPFIEGWRCIHPFPAAGQIGERYLVENEASKRIAVLTVFPEGAQPDPSVYDVLQKTELDHVPETIAYGYCDRQPYDITEHFPLGDLKTIDIDPSDTETFRMIVDEIGRALNNFAETGLRHRDLRPENIVIRDRDALDLVITGFSSARLSEFDLDIVAPLEVTRYMAPEAVLGGVAAEADWWSLGMILLEIVTRGRCFEGVNDQAFLIHALAGGVSLPDDLPADTALLLRGLLARERSQRWQWEEVKAWLDGRAPEAPHFASEGGDDRGSRISLGNASYVRASDYTFAAAGENHWDEALDHFQRGRLIAWAEDIGIGSRRLAFLRNLCKRDLDDDFKLGVALKAINPDLPYVRRGEIVNAGWLLKSPSMAYRLIESEVPDLLLELDSDSWGWLAHLKRRAATVRKRAAYHEIDLNEADLRVCLLTTSRARLAAIWDERRKLHPAANHRGLEAIAGRRQLLDEDLIILVSAGLGQFRTVEEVVDETARLANEAGLKSINLDNARSILRDYSAREIFELVTKRIENFASCDYARINEWADQFRHDRRMDLSKALLILEVPPEEWKQPAHQQYLSDLISFFEQKVAIQIKRGPLARMTIGKTSKRIDICDLGTSRTPASAILERIIERSQQKVSIDPAVFADNSDLDSRLRGLHQDAALYKRDTGIDGLFVGFPFLIYRPPSGTIRPRIAPILLWPVRIDAEVGARGSYKVCFDADREEVRLNPALEAFLGADALEKWREAAEDALSRTSSIGDIIDDLGHMASPRERVLTRLPGPDIDVTPGAGQIICSAVMFHVTFMGQAVVEDLRYLKKAHPQNTALETMLRLGNKSAPEEDERASPDEADQFFTVASDPSQKRAVLSARYGAGLVIEGPPGTGKSQTIVNLVADAIGRGKNLLLVCQKHAALDVVRKRLDAEGLGNRFVMVNDVHRDRRVIVRSIREQIESIFKEQSQDNRLQSQRRQLGSRIEALENELDRHHQALHEVDPSIGRSYRDIVSELIVLEEGESGPIDALAVREFAQDLDIERLTTTEELCAPLGRDWLNAHYEGNPLAALKRFSWDQATCAAFHLDFETFYNHEAERTRQIAERPKTLGLHECSDEELALLLERGQLAVEKRSFWSALSSSYHVAKYKLRSFLKSRGEEGSDANLESLLASARYDKACRSDIAKARDRSLDTLQMLERWFNAEWLSRTRRAIHEGVSRSDQIEELRRFFPTLSDYQRFRSKAQSLTPEAWQFFAALRKSEAALKALPSADLENEIRRTLNREARLAWKANMEAKQPELLFEKDQIDAKIRKLGEIDRQMRDLNQGLLTSTIDRRRLGTLGKWEDITRLQGPRMMRLREFLERGKELGLFALRPIWLMNPDVASRLLPQSRGLFDLVVYDEASQMPIEFALPTLFRGQSVVISGDEKQLPPTSFFASRIENDEAEIYEGAEPDKDASDEEVVAAEEAWNRREIKDCPDLLELGRAVLPHTLLEIHYRSKYRQLIDYSNAAFYSDRLNVPVQHPGDEVGRAKPIEVIHADGIYEAQTNVQEAEYVVNILATQWRQGERRTMGIVTFNRKQADLIKSQLEERAEADEEFRAAYDRELGRIEDGEDMGIFVKNVENVQGDERDIIIFSTTFGRDPRGRFRRFFGVLGQRGGERRLNVAISRAREKVMIVTSMPVSEISDMLYARRRPSTPRDYLQGYLQFAEHLSEGRFEGARGVLRQVGSATSQLSDRTDQHLSDEFPRLVAKFMGELGYTPERPADASIFAVDFAVRHPANGLFGIGIECDAPKHRILNNARDREIWRSKLLAQNLPCIHRVSSYGWYHYRDAEKVRLAKAIEHALR